MEYLIDTENISLDYSEDRELNDKPSYRLTLYDKHGNFDTDVYLRYEQVKDLVNLLKENNNLK